MYKRIPLCLLFMLLIGRQIAFAQQVNGQVIDSLTHEPVPYLSVYYEGTGVGSITDQEGFYRLETRAGWTELTFSAVGYDTKVVKIDPQHTRTLNVVMRPSDLQIAEVVVKPRRERYSRRNNPAVELMRKVIAHKSVHRIAEHPFYQYNRYQKITFSLNNVTDEVLHKGVLKKVPFLKDQVERSAETGKMILPLSVDETASQVVYRKNPESKKTIIKGVNRSGVNDLFNTGDLVNTVLKDVFADVNIYDNEIRLLQKRFVSPISSVEAISFYKYYIMDTLQIDRDRCIHLTFVPNNPQDFGFTGHLYVVADSTFQVKRCIMNLPARTAVNFVDNLLIHQEFEQLPTGERVLKTDDMLVELAWLKMLYDFQVRRHTSYANYSFDALPPAVFERKGAEQKEANAMMRTDDFWEAYRTEPLTTKESAIDHFVRRLEEMPGFKYVVFAGKAFIENFVETGVDGRPSKVDIGPVNTMFSHNFVDGFRLRASAQTTAHLNPHWFFKGYGAYGFKDRKFKYKGEVEYSFQKKEYLPREYPKHSLLFSYQYDVMSPADKFLKTDKDNVFVSFKAFPADQMSYMRHALLQYERETLSGLTATLQLKHSTDCPTGSLSYIRNDEALTPVGEMVTFEASAHLRYAPGETFVNTKNRRVPVSLDAPVFTLSHTAGFRGVAGGQYDYQLTQVGFYKRFWLSSWGKVDFYLKGGVQWSKVPFPLLIMPAANLSYILQRETFNLLTNMEFLNDRFVSLDASWDLNGKLLNRVPLVKKLKWREVVGVKVLYGTLTDRNNPYKRPHDGDLFLFPTRHGEPVSFVMESDRPYMEWFVGVHNIFKLLHIDYVRRVNYLSHPDVSDWGIRFMLRMAF